MDDEVLDEYNEIVNIPLPNLPRVAVAVENAVDVNGNVIPQAQIIRREVAQANQICGSQTKSKLLVIFTVFESMTSFLLAYMYLQWSSKSVPRTFPWRRLSQFLYLSIVNSSVGCQDFAKALPVPTESGIRPRLNSKDFCVIDKSIRICPQEIENEWFAIPLIPFLTFVLPILLNILTICYMYGINRMDRQSVTKMICPIYMLLVVNPLIFLFGWVKQVLSLVVGEILKGDMLLGYNLMNSPNDVSHQWEITQEAYQCCGFQSYRDWNVTAPHDRYPLSCCDSTIHQCTKMNLPTKEQVWGKGCYALTRNDFVLQAGMITLLMFFKVALECVFCCFIVDYGPTELVETSLIHCRDFSARAFGRMEIRDVVTDNRIIVSMINFRPRVHNILIERVYRHVEIVIRSRGVIYGNVHIMPTNGLLSLDDIVIHQDQSHRGIFEITSNTPDIGMGE